MIHWITENLGMAAFDKVSHLSDICIVDVRDLVDKGGNSVDSIKTKIDRAIAYLNQDEKVVVCCDYGMSRSNAVVAGILAKHENINLNQAIRKVIELTGEKSIKIEVLNIVRASLGVLDEQSTLNQRKSLLITGANGFIGKGLVPQLSEIRYTVSSPTRKEIDLLQDTVELDLLVKEKRISTILHLANPRIYTTNVSMGESFVMLKNVLDVCAQNRIRLIYLSDWEVYSGYQAQELRADETLPHCPGNVYGQTKMLCESLIKCYQRQYNLSYLILRSSLVYGFESDMPKFIWNFLNKAKRNIEIITHMYKNGFPALDLLHINDLRQAIISAIDKDLNGAINLGTGVGTTTAWIAEWIVQKTGSSSSIRHQKIDTFVGNIVMNNSRAHYLLGWKPTISIKEGLQPIIESISRSDK